MRIMRLDGLQWNDLAKNPQRAGYPPLMSLGPYKHSLSRFCAPNFHFSYSSPSTFFHSLLRRRFPMASFYYKEKGSDVESVTVDQHGSCSLPAQAASLYNQQPANKRSSRGIANDPATIDSEAMIVGEFRTLRSIPAQHTLPRASIHPILVFTLRTPEKDM